MLTWRRIPDALGVSTFLIRGFDPLEDAIDYGERLIPRVRRLVEAEETAHAAREQRA